MVVPDAFAVFGKHDTQVIESLRRMFGEDILRQKDVYVAYHDTTLCGRYAESLPDDGVKSVGFSDECATDADSLLKGLYRVEPELYTNQGRLVFVSAPSLSVSMAQRLVRARFNAEISEMHIQLLRATTHGAFLFTSERKGVPVIVSFPPRLPEK